MTDDARPIPAPTGDEPTVLTEWLTFHRETLRRKCAGLDAEQLARRAVPPSTMSLLGLLRHMAEVERGWFRRTIAGEDVPHLFCSDEEPDADFQDAAADPALVDEAWAAWRDEVAAADRIVASTGLETTGKHHWVGAVSLRWVLVHMIEEYARHNGHADLLREAVDGETGA